MVFLTKRNTHQIRTLHWRADQMMSEALAQVELTASQGGVMAYLNHQKTPPCPKDVEEEFHMSHSCVSGILSRLEKKGFIALLPDEKDRRSKRIHVLDKGRKVHDHMHSTILGINARMVEGFTPEEQEVFHSLLDRAIQNMGGHPGCRKEEKP